MARARDVIRHPRSALGAARRKLNQARDVARGVSLDLAASTEVRQATLRALIELDERLRATEAALAGHIEAALAEDPSLADGYLRRVVGGSIDDVTPGLANLLTHEHGSTGFQAQAGLWINSPLWLIYEPGRVHVHAVNERIVEIPFAFSVAQTLPAGARILDVGASDSTTALSLASLGYEVTALDFRPYPLQHARLHVVTDDLLAWRAPAPFDAALCVSTIEHVGLGWYGDPIDPDGDRRALERVRDQLRPGGLLALTVPFGSEQAGEHQRTYDNESLGKLLDGWNVDEVQIVARDERGEWSAASRDDDALYGVALVRAHHPPS